MTSPCACVVFGTGFSMICVTGTIALEELVIGKLRFFIGISCCGETHLPSMVLVDDNAAATWREEDDVDNMIEDMMHNNVGYYH